MDNNIGIKITKRVFNDCKKNMENGEVETMDWSTCPSDVLLLILKYLDNNTLTTCLSVCKSWRNVVDYFAQVHDLWDVLSQNSLYNKGKTYKLKSNLSWRDIYFNSILWRTNTYFKLDGIIQQENVKYIHLYKDKIILVNNLAADYYCVETLKRIDQKPNVLDCQRNDHVDVLQTNKNYLTIKFKHNQHSFNIRCYEFKFIGDYCFVVDETNVIWMYNFLKDNFMKRPILRSYLSTGSILDLNHYEKDVYVLKENGNILLTKCYISEADTIARVTKLNLKSCNVICMFLKYSVIYNVPKREGLKRINVMPLNDSEVVIECPGLTCAMPHGEIVFLGYDDGNIIIFSPVKNFNVNDPILQFNIKDVVEDVIEDPTIKGIEIHEAKDMHYLFVLTKFSLFKFILYHNKE